jgi:predicted metalloprotease
MADKDRSFRDEQLTFCVRYVVDLEVREHLAEASGLLNQMQRREFIVCLVVRDKVLSQVQVVHALLQKKT